MIKWWRNLRNSIYLALWRSTKRVGQERNIRLTRKYDNYYGVIDLVWKLEDRKQGGTPLRGRCIVERANTWNLRETIRRIEQGELLQELADFEKRMAERD